MTAGEVLSTCVMIRPRRNRYPSLNRLNDKPLRQRATDQEIKKWVLRHHGFVPESAWIDHCKELFGVPGASWLNAENPCPPEKVPVIKQAFREFGLLANLNEPNA